MAPACRSGRHTGHRSGWQVMYLIPQPNAEKDVARDRYLFLNTVWEK